MLKRLLLVLPLILITTNLWSQDFFIPDSVQEKLILAETEEERIDILVDWGNYLLTVNRDTLSATTLLDSCLRLSRSIRYIRVQIEVSNQLALLSLEVKDSLQGIKYYQSLFNTIVIEPNKPKTKSSIISSSFYFLFFFIIILLFILTTYLFYLKKQIKKHKIKIKKQNNSLLEKERKVAEISQNFEKELLDAMNKIKEETLQKIARELHDNVGSQLASLSLQFQALEANIDLSKDANMSAFEDFKNGLRSIYNEVRELSHGMSGIYLNTSLISAIKELVSKLERSSGIKIEYAEYNLENFDKIDNSSSLQIFRILQELLINVVKHANADSLKMQLAYRNDNLNIIVADNGIGFNSSTYTPGVGLKSVNERVKFLNGEIYINSAEGNGTTIEIDIPINLPEAIINQGTEALEKWKSHKEKIPLYEAKIVLVGNGGVGKTTLRENLINPNYKLKKHPSTHGLDIKKWETQVPYKNQKVKFRFNIWDFGGQGKYRMIQQFFCTPNTLYIYITTENDIDGTRDKYIGFPYWKDLIKTLSQPSFDQLSTPIIYVYSKIDLVPNYIEKLIAKKDEIDQIQKISTINEFKPISCKTGEGLDELSTVIKNFLQYIGNEIFTEKYPITWLAVKEELEKLPQDYISYEEYERICKNKGLEIKSYEQEKSEANIWLEVLHTIGIIIHFPQIPFLKNIIILKSEWLRNAAYNVLDCQKIIEQNGKFKEEDFPFIWPHQSRDDRNRLIELMKAFELCYEYLEENDSVYSVPALFPILRSEESFSYLNYLSETQSIVMIKCIFTPFLPAGILNNIIVRRHQIIYQDYYWQTGVVFLQEETFIEINEDWRHRLLIIKLNGKNVSFMTQEILLVIDTILEEKFNSRITYSPVLSFNDESFDYRKLLKDKSVQINETYSEFLKAKVSIDDLIEGRYKEVGINQYKSVNQIHDLIKADNLREALFAIERIASDKKYKINRNDVIILASRLTNLTKDHNLGIINYQEYTIEKNKIKKAVLGLLP